MSTALTTDTELAARFGITVERFHDLRRRHGWPAVRLGRFDFRFTDEQVAQIIAMQTEKPDAKTGPKTPVTLPGQTAASASRRRSA